VINRRFRESNRAWTIQRKDVDSFYGSFFEADFISIQDAGRLNPVDVLTDRRLSGRLRPSIIVEDEKVAHYVPEGPVPDHHSIVAVETQEGTVPLVLKMERHELLDRVSQRWEIGIEKDLRLASLVSVLKAAHLTLFYLLGYNYGLSAGGWFVGRTILGDFFDAHDGEERAAIIEAGEAHFPDFVNMARPLLAGADELQGTVSDGRLYLCGAGPPWAMLVIVRTAQIRHAVLVPILDDAERAAHFIGFLKSPHGELAVRFAEFNDDRFDVSPRIHRFEWPTANYHSVDT